MGEFLEREKIAQARFKAEADYFSEAARADGLYRGIARPFCLPAEFAVQNLYSGIRETAPAYFLRHQIKWHGGKQPSNHLCSSQICCLNFLFPFADKPEELAQLLRPVYPLLGRMLSLEDEQFVAFEWIGCKDYLGENKNQNRKRTRGALFTSADAAVMFERSDGKRQIVLIEWKYSESYGRSSLQTAKSGTDRRKIYQRLFDLDDCPLDKNLLPSFDSLFYEPFYQLMRQQLLANEMEKAQEKDAQIVTVLHIAPAQNLDFHRITSPLLEQLGETTAMGIWKKLVRSDKFLSVTTEQLFGNLSADQMPQVAPWLDYIAARYSWVRQNN